MRKLTILVTLLLIGFIPLLYSQGTQIKGKVTSSEDGNSLPGASVVVKGTNVATITDADGNYSLNIPQGSASIWVSFVGMKTQEVKLSGQTTVDVVLSPEVVGLEEVVVTALGITRQEKSVGYSVTSVNSAEVRLKGEPDALRSLEGKVPGVYISSSSGAPGTSTRINIRGMSSFFGSNEPLFVVDGTPYSNDYIETIQPNVGGGGYLSGISSLDPNDIQTISVLKGAAASALYGSRAANGVVMITTKSGSVSKSPKGFEVSFTTSTSFEQIANLPEYQNDYGAGVDFNFANANGSWGPKFEKGMMIPTWDIYKQTFPTMPDSIPYKAYPNNIKDLFRTGVLFDNSLNVAGGTDRSNFNLTVSDLNQTGYIPYSSFMRQSLSVGGSTKLTNGLTFSGSISYAHNKQDGSFYGDNQFGSTTSSGFARTLFLNRAWDMDLPDTDPSTGGTLLPNGNTQADNPKWAWRNNKITSKTDRTIVNLGIAYRLFDMIDLKYQVGVNTYGLNRLQLLNKGSRAYSAEGYITLTDAYSQEIESNLMASLTRKINDDIELKVMVGQGMNQRLYQDKTINGQNMIVPGVYTIENTLSIASGGTTFSKRRLTSVLGDIELSYKNYLFFTVTGRNDWSSTLEKDKNSYFYPSVAGSFVFSDAFELDKEVFSLGKVRLSWAQVGKDADPYAYNGQYTVRTNLDNYGFPFNGKAALIGDDYYYDKLVPEKSSEIEVGTQLNFFKSRIGFDFTYYNKSSINQIAPLSLPSSTGYSTFLTNFGELNNKGVEISLSLVPLKLANSLTWDISVNYTKNISKVVKLKPGVDRLILEYYGASTGFAAVLETGKPYGIFRGSYSARDSLGNLLIDPSTGTTIVAKNNKTVGDPNPDFLLGISNTFSFKGLHVSFLIDYKKGGDVYSTTIQNELGRGVTKDTWDREGSFIVPGVIGDPNTATAVLDNNGKLIKNTYQVSLNEIYFGEGSFATNGPDEWSIFDGTYYRLREISFGYDIPKKILGKLPIGSASISVVGRNLWYYCPNVPKYTNFDTEVSAYGPSNVQGIEFSSAPSVRRYGVSLRLTF